MTHTLFFHQRIHPVFERIQEELNNRLLYGNPHGPVHGPTPRGTLYEEIAADIVSLPYDGEADDVDCGNACEVHPTYGWAPEADCPVHDSPRKET